jgi:hypothetical protein
MPHVPSARPRERQKYLLSKMMIVAKVERLCRTMISKKVRHSLENEEEGGGDGERIKAMVDFAVSAKSTNLRIFQARTTRICVTGIAIQATNVSKSQDSLCLSQLRRKPRFV